MPVGVSRPPTQGRSELQARAGVLDLLRERPADLGVVDDAGVEDVQRGDAGDVRLELAQPRRSDQLGAHAVRAAPPLELGQAVAVDLVGRDHDLAGHRVVDPVLPAVLDHREPTGRAHAGLLRAGPVVDAGVDHPGVAAALVRADRRFLLDDHDRPTSDPRAGSPARSRARRCPRRRRRRRHVPSGET